MKLIILVGVFALSAADILSQGQINGVYKSQPQRLGSNQGFNQNQNSQSNYPSSNQFGNQQRNQFNNQQPNQYSSSNTQNLANDQVNNVLSNAIQQFESNSNSNSNNQFNQAPSQQQNFGSFQQGNCADGMVRSFDGSCSPVRVNNKYHLFAPPQSRSRAQQQRTLVVPNDEVQFNHVFVKTPENQGGNKPIIVGPPEEKTLVYVLNKEAQDKEREIVRIQSKINDPEVYYVNYNGQNSGNSPRSNFNNQRSQFSQQQFQQRRQNGRSFSPSSYQNNQRDSYQSIPSRQYGTPLNNVQRNSGFGSPRFNSERRQQRQQQSISPNFQSFTPEFRNTRPVAPQFNANPQSNFPERQFSQSSPQFNDRQQTSPFRPRPQQQFGSNSQGSQLFSGNSQSIDNSQFSDNQLPNQLVKQPNQHSNLIQISRAN